MVMKRVLPVVLLVACGGPTPSGVSTTTPPVPFEDGGLHGYRDASGAVVIPARYALAGPFADGMAAVANAEGWAYIDTEGEVLVRPFVFDNGPDPFSEGLARFVEDGRYGFFDVRGAVVIPATFDWVEPFAGGTAAFCTGCTKVMYGENWSMEGGEWGHIDRTGAVIAP